MQQRDNEINILVSMLKKREAAMGLLSPATATLPPPVAPQPISSTSHAHSKPNLPLTSTQLPTTLPPTHANLSNLPNQLQLPSRSVANTAEPHYGSSTSNLAPNPLQAGVGLGGGRGGATQQASSSGVDHHNGEAALLDVSILADRGKAFEVFR